MNDLTLIKWLCDPLVGTHEVETLLRSLPLLSRRFRGPALEFSRAPEDALGVKVAHLQHERAFWHNDNLCAEDDGIAFTD